MMLLARTLVFAILGKEWDSPKALWEALEL
jgi:hypothetical protein